MKILVLLLIDFGYIYRIIGQMKNDQMKCHKLNDRCLPIMRNKKWRVCSRCLFMYIGIGMYPFTYILVKSIDVNILSGLILAVVMQVPMLVDGFTQRFTKRTSNNWLRSLTGLISGLGLSLFICSLILMGGY